MTMEKLLIITEKPSAGRNFQEALGGSRGTFDGHPYIIVSLRGHILAHETPEKVAFPNHAKTVGGFAKIDAIPWDYKYFDFNKRVIPDSVRDYANNVIAQMREAIADGYIPVVASDIDALGEGDLLVHEVLIYLGYEGKIYREYHVDETPKSIKKALREKKDVTARNDGFIAGQTRMVLDFLTQQIVRVATVTIQDKGYRLPRPVPAGRLQSTIMNMVGQQIDAIKAYVPSSKFESRYNLDDILTLTNPDVEQFPDKASWHAGDLPTESRVKEVKQVPGKTAPPKALTLTGLGKLMSRQGLSAKQTTDLAQKMYDDGVLSYPRTEDNFITPEQFDEITPQLDRILGLLGLAPNVFTRREPRSTHVKEGGSHGALRPGVNIPSDVDGLDAKYGRGASKVYRLVAERFTMMYLEDTEWVRHEYETIDTPIPFKGSIRIVTKKGVVDPDEDMKDVAAKLPNLENKAKIYAHEVKTTKPKAPTEAWLLGQLEKHEVGTAATQMSTVSRLIGKNNNFPLLAGSKTSAPLTLSPIGTVGYQVAKDISLGSPESTRYFENVIKEVVKGTKTEHEVYEAFTQTIAEDVQKIKSMSFDMDGLGFQKSAARVEGVWNGEKVSIKDSTNGYTFTQAELDTLFAGGSVTFTGKDFNGNDAEYSVMLGRMSYKGKPYVGFMDARYCYGTWNGEEIRFNRKYSSHTFTDAECEQLLNGEEVHIAIDTKDGKIGVHGKLAKLKAPNGASYIGFDAVFPLREGYVRGVFKGKEITFKGSFADHTFTQEEIDRLLSGGRIGFKFTTKAGKESWVEGTLEKQAYKGKPFYGFKADFGKKK